MEKSKEDQARQWNRIASLASQFETEHHVYMKFVFDGYDMKRFAIMKQQFLTYGKAEKKIPVIGKEKKRPQSPGCISREQGFDQGSQTDDEIGSPDARAAIAREESKMSKDALRSSSPTRLPRYQDPSQKKYMSAVKKDLNYFKMTGKRQSSLAHSACSNHRSSVELASVQERDDVNLASQTINIKKDGVTFEDSLKKKSGPPNLSRTQKVTQRLTSS